MSAYTWTTVDGEMGSTISVVNHTSIVPGTIAIEAQNPNYDEFDTIGLIVTAANARQLAAALTALADEIEGRARFLDVANRALEAWANGEGRREEWEARADLRAALARLYPEEQP